jgi:hypothetical protein
MIRAPYEGRKGWTMTHRALAWTLVIATVLLLGASGKYRLIDRWENPEDHLRFKKFLVVGISEIREARHQFENNFVSQLRGRDIEGMASYRFVPTLVGIDDAERDKILAIIEEEKIDGVITVRAVPLKNLSEEAWISSWKKRVASDSTLRELIEESLPLVDEKAKRYGVELTVWDVETGARFWGGRTNVLNRKQLSKGVPEFVRGVIGALVMADLV